MVKYLSTESDELGSITENLREEEEVDGFCLYLEQRSWVAAIFLIVAQLYWLSSAFPVEGKVIPRSALASKGCRSTPAGFN